MSEEKKDATDGGECPALAAIKKDRARREARRRLAQQREDEDGQEAERLAACLAVMGCDPATVTPEEVAGIKEQWQADWDKAASDDAEVDRLREALEQIVHIRKESTASYEDDANDMWNVAASALAGEPLPPLAEVARLQGMVERMAERIASQSDQLSRRAEKGTEEQA